MSNINLVVMGKTGAGKSTLINAILGEEKASTGVGMPITKENCVYSKEMEIFIEKVNPNKCKKFTLNLYDTVGLEIDSKITQATVEEVEMLIQTTQRNEENDELSLVLFCVHYRADRFEQYEIDLIKSLSIEHEVPFMIVLTQCYSDEVGNLEKQIKNELPELPVMRVLAKDYKMRSNIVIPAYGVDELLQTSILEYEKAKVHILESKLDKLVEDMEKTIAKQHEKIRKIRQHGKVCIDSYSKKAGKIGFLPGGCIPVVHGICISMIVELNRLAGLNSSKEIALEVFNNAVLGAVATPFMAIPLISFVVAISYIEVVGEAYLESLINVIQKSTKEELNDTEFLIERLKSELKNK